MREMKDSGIEWIGEIPADWEVSTIKREYVFQTGWTPDTTHEEYFVGENIWINISDMKSKVLYDSEKHISDEAVRLASMNISPKGSLLYAFKLSVGAVSFCGIDMYTNEAIATFLPGKNNLRFLYYTAPIFIIKNANENIYGAKLLNQKLIRNAKIVIPPLEVQKRIVDYLDRKCSQIDAIIARQQEVIEKLKAYKLSVITEAVTKGLNPDVSMKDSGVEWIGEIPEHWDFRKIKNCCLIVDCKNRTPDPDPDGEYIVVRTTCIRDGSFSYEGSYHTNAENFKEWTAKGQPQHGDIFFTREAPMGEACLVPDADNLCMGQRVMFFRPLDGSDPRYILYSIYGPLAREYIDCKNKGSTVGHLKLGQVASLPLFYCPPKEQSEIADYLDKRCGAIDKVVEKKAEIISKLTDYKKSLIYEVVTGKKEV